MKWFMGSIENFGKSGAKNVILIKMRERRIIALIGRKYDFENYRVNVCEQFFELSAASR